MSIHQNHWIIQWQTFLEDLPGAYIWNGRQLSPSDCQTWREALLLWSILCEDLDTGYLQSQRVIKKWIRYVSTLDTYSVGTYLKKADKFITSYIGWDNPPSSDMLSYFKHSLEEDTGINGEMLSPISRLLSEFFRSKGIPQYRACHQFLTFTSRVSFKDIPDDEVINDFIDTDENLVPPCLELARAINRIIREWFRGFSVDDVPSHGPGSTADAGRGSLRRKYDALGTDQLLSYVLRRNCPEFDRIGDKVLDRTAKLQCVPKTMLTKRTICMEPATLQFYQQMVRKSVYRWLKNHPYLRRVIKLDDQNQNRHFAYIGSLLGTISTIDLSKASDSVTWELARLAFSHTPLLPWLYATRSRAVSVSKDRVVVTKKFAPMGSALCFPVECIIFAAICELAKREVLSKRCDVTYSVYGDDIAITTEVVPIVMSYLTLLGFTVNVDKSFYNDNVFCYRESCGAEFLSGVDVSPLKISRGFESGSLDRYHPGRVENLVQLANACWAKGFLGCRRWIIHRLHHLPRDLRPVFGPGQSQINSYTSTNWKNAIRFNRKLQRLEVKGGVTSCRCKPDIDDTVRYLHYQLCALERQKDAERHRSFDELITDVINTDTGQLDHPRLVSRWLG